MPKECQKGTAAANATLSPYVLSSGPATRKCHSHWRQVPLLNNHLVSRLNGSIRTNGPSDPRSCVSGQPNNVCYSSGPATKKVSEMLAGRTSARHRYYRLLQDIDPTARVPQMASGIHRYSKYFFISFIRPASLYSQQYVHIYCIYRYPTA